MPSFHSFQSPEDVAQLIIDGKMSVFERSQYVARHKNVIVLDIPSSGETVLLYAPENDGVLENGADFSIDIRERLEYAGLVSTNTSLVLATPDDFKSIHSIVFDPNKPKIARDTLSYFSAEEGDGVNRLVESVLARARKLGASDVHFQPK